MKYLPIIVVSFFVLLISCMREPELHLYEPQTVEIKTPAPKIELKVLWDYKWDVNVNVNAHYQYRYDWEAEWVYGWDDEDRENWGELGYTDPTVFNVRRYFSGDVAFGKHIGIYPTVTIYGNTYEDKFEWGFWDLLVWNEPQVTVEGQAIRFDESDPEHITAETSTSMYRSRYYAPRYTYAFNAPEPLVTVYDQGFEVNRDLRGFTYDAERDIYVREIPLELLPVTYIYLVQVVLIHNNGRIKELNGEASLSGMARTTCLQTRRAGDDAISVYYKIRKKHNVPYVPIGKTETEMVDVIGGRLMSFGMCGVLPYEIDETINNMDDNEIRELSGNSKKLNGLIKDPNKHYIDFNVTFNNGKDSTIVKEVTDQVRMHYKGGVITVELDMDTVPIPKRAGGSGFQAVVKDFEEVPAYEIDFDKDK